MIRFHGGKSNPDDAPLIGGRKVAADQTLKSDWEFIKKARAHTSAWLQAVNFRMDSLEDGKIVTRNDEFNRRHAEYMDFAARATGGGTWKIPYARKARGALTAPATKGFAHGGARSRKYYKIVHESGISLLVAASSRYGKYIQTNSRHAPPSSWEIEEVVAEGGIGGVSIWTRANNLVRDANSTGDTAAISSAEDLKTRVCTVATRGLSEEILAHQCSEMHSNLKGYSLQQRTKTGSKYVAKSPESKLKQGE